MIVFRYYFYKYRFGKCGSNVSIHKRVTILHPEKMALGKNVSIHTMCYIDALGGLTIGDNVSIAHSVTIMTYNHTWSDLDKPIKYNPMTVNCVEIGNDVWIASTVRIMPGVCIQNRVVIAAGAVVTNDCLSSGLYAGVPARRIKDL